MTAPVLDDFLLRLAPAPPVAVAPELLRARDSIRASLNALREVPDSALELVWHWRGGELDVRYGFYRQYEGLEDARARVRPLVAGAQAQEGPARPIVAAATAARWDLHGLLASVGEADLDRDPGNDEWTVRQTLAHIVNGQRAYGWSTAWWLARRDAPLDDYPERWPDDVSAALPEEDTEASGTLADIRRRLDDILDLSAGVFGPLGEEEVAARARWSGVAVDVRFRLLRWSSHIREHTIQVEKTLAFIGRPTTEVDRLLRLICAAYGRLEEELFQVSASPRTSEALALAESAAMEVLTGTRSVAEAASA